MSAGIVGLQAAVDLLVEAHLLLVVVEAKAGQQAQAIGHRPASLSEERGADVLEADVLVEAIAVEQPGRRR